MQKALIKLIYRHIIDAASVTDLEKQIFEATYNEFLLKSQAYNQQSQFKTFSEMKNADGRANSLHYKTSFAVIHFINAFNNKIPFLFDTLEKNIVFDSFHFELIESHVIDKTRHRVAINFITADLTLNAMLGNYFLLSEGNRLNEPAGKTVETFMLKMQTGLSVMSYSTKEETSFAAN